MQNDPRTRHLVDPALMPAVEMYPPVPLTTENLAGVREAMSVQYKLLAAPPIAPVEKVIDGPDGAMTVLWFDPSPGANDRPAILHIHGGGMVMGSAEEMTREPAGLAMRLGVPVASVDYRLAPEAPFPGPQEDCYAALVWLAGAARDLGVDAARIAITGESAGGGLAAAVAHMARDRGGPRLTAQLLIYPMLDYRVGGELDPWRNQNAGEFIWTRELNQFGWQSLMGDYRADDARKGWFSPSIADDLAGLPPTWIGVGALDLFIDENLDYARRLIDAGVPVELHVYPGAVHGFNLFDTAGEAMVIKAFNRDYLIAAARMLGLPISA